MKTAYVTGATACVGRNLVNALLEDGGWDIVVLHRATSDLTRLAGCRVRFQEVNLHDLESVRSAIPKDIDAIFHVAANTSHWSKDAGVQWKDNVLATRNLTQVALEKRTKRFIFTSTGATLAYQSKDEKNARSIRNGYVRTKRLAELAVYHAAELGLDVVLLHPVIVFGPYDYNNYSQIFSEVKKGFRIALPGKIAFGHAGDIARAHVAAYYRGRTCEHYVLGGEYSSWEKVTELITHRVGVPKAVLMPKWALFIMACAMDFASRFTGKRPLLTPDLVSLLGDAPDVTFPEKQKSRLELDYQSRSLAVMVDDCYRWLTGEQKAADITKESMLVVS